MTSYAYHAGSQQCNFVEKLADTLLALPKAMWQNREVRIIEKDDDLEISCEAITSCQQACFSAIQNDLIVVMAGLADLPCIIVASPFWLKESTLSRSDP